jgi:ATP synthase protein I
MASNQKSRQRPKLKLASLGAELAGAIIGLTLLGLWVDHRFGTGPWALVIFAVLGCVGGLYNLIRSSLKALETTETTSRKAGDDGAG